MKLNTIRGFNFGVLLLLAQINLFVGLPLMFLGFVVYYRNIRFDTSRMDLKIVLIIQIIWMILIWSALKSSSLFGLMQQISPFVILLSLLFFKVDQSFIKGFAIPLSALLLVDLLFNMLIFIYGVDPFGRGGGLREGDYLPRLGGLFGNSFASINIAAVGIFCGLILRSRMIVLFSLINLLINGTFKSPLLLITFLMFYFASKRRVKLGTIVLASLIFASAVFSLAIYKAGNEIDSGNTLRVIAWVNAIDKILQNPFLGTHTFLNNNTLKEMSAVVIVEHGIAESPYLQYALDYGVLAMISYFYIMFRLLHISYSRFIINAPEDEYRRFALILAGMIFVDSFYGTFFGSVYTTYFSGMIILAYSKDKNG